MNPKDLDEYEEYDLEIELDTRRQLRAEGRCDYCGEFREKPACKFPDRHNRKAE